jgi:N-acetylneuraminic acid mutarotase
MRAASARAGVALLAMLAAAGSSSVVGCGADSGPSGAGGWGALAPSPLMRTEVGAARVGDSIYVLGGFTSPAGNTTRQMARYDISDDEWELVSPAPIAVNHPGVTALRGRLYLLGGNWPAQGVNAKSDRLYSYNPGTDRWARLPDAPTARGALALVGIGGRLYAAGGATEGNAEVRRLEIYDIERRRWRIAPPMEVGRNHVAGATVERKVYVIGGRPGPISGGRPTVERYDPRTRRWRRMPPLTTARSGHAAAVAGGRIVVFGGEELTPGGSTISAVELFDPATRRWSELPAMVTPRHGLGGASDGTRVFALEGGPMPGLAYSSANEFLDVP